jgi:hypothetical protein
MAAVIVGCLAGAAAVAHGPVNPTSPPVEPGSFAVSPSASPVDPAAIKPGHPTGHVHDHGDETWPPQPRGMTNVVTFSDPAGEARANRILRNRAEQQERFAEGRADVQLALGTRHTRPFIEEEDDKNAPSGLSRLVYFSHSNNVTVAVTMDSQKFRSITRISPSDYQPEITDEETAEAAEIARSYFLTAGKDRVASLQPFGILAYRPVGKGFYDTRVLYISFHQDNDSPPEFVAWVDLTQRRVIRAREEQP